MFHRQQILKSFGQAGGGPVASVMGGKPGRSRVAWLLFFALPAAALVAAFVTTVPHVRLAGSFQALADTWRQLVAGVPDRFDPSRLMRVDATTRPAAAPSASPVGFGSEQHNVIWYGDRLKITFFESLGVRLGDRSGDAEQSVATIFPRMDLSGEYRVDEDGTFNVPRLGQFAATGQTIPGLQSKLAATFQRVIGRTSDVHVDIVDREPVYVLGTVRNTGSFKHVPGMIVLQALASAGGIDTGAGDTSKAIENIRETEHLRLAETRLDSLLLKQARLIAQRENADTITVPPAVKARLSDPALRDRVKALVAGATATLSVERSSYQQQLSLTGRQIGIARAELSAQEMRASQLKELLSKKDSKLHELAAIAARGSVSQFKLMDMNVDISEFVARQEDLHVSLAQAQSRLADAEIAQAKLKMDYSIGLDRELAGTQQEIDDCEHSILSMREVTQVLRDSLPASAGGPTKGSALRIIRRGAEGVTSLVATETTALRPGDVVQVQSSRRSDTPAGIAQDTQHLQD